MTIPKTADAFTIYKSEKVQSKCVGLTSNVHIHQYELSIRTFFTLNVEVGLWLRRHTWLGYITIIRYPRLTTRSHKVIKVPNIGQRLLLHC